MSTHSERSQEFVERLQECQSQVLRYIFILVRNGDDAADVFQQTCVVLWNKFDQFDPSHNFSSWACGVARFEARKFLAKHRRHEAQLSDEFAQELADSQMESGTETIEARQIALPGCIAKLPPPQQELLKLCYGENRRVVDVAVGLGRSVCGVHHSLRVIREKLMECIERAVREGER
jgi:RNA polymerase sigma-70 factor, ECF subfamily